MTYRYCPENWSRLSALLESAPDLPDDQQLSWIENLATESQEVKAQLRRLLAAAIPADKFLCKRPNFAAVMLDETACFKKIEIELQPDRLIGAYRLIRELGHGGMGSVWLAQRIDGKFKRDVALKFPFAGPRQRQLVERLIREREILAGLQHANIARLYDADVTASGQPFLVLEYIDGVAINDYCAQHRLDIRARLLLFQQVLSAVRYAHAHLVIHRDLKPSNILITDDGVVHLLDFGIATFIADGAAHTTPLTQFGGHVLTPEYASPEQVAGLTITTASDVYALGLVLYELLTGNSPYRWQRDHRVQLEEAIANADVISPSHAIISNEIATSRNTQPRQLGKILRGEVNTLLLKALKKNVDARYASADEFYQDISRYLEHQPIHAQPDSQWYRIRKFARRNRVVVASFAAIMAALLTGAGIALWQAHQASLQRDQASLQRDRAVASAAQSEAVSDFLQLMVTDVADANEPITMQQLIARSEDIANRTYGGDADQQASILEMLGSYYLAFNGADRANEAFGKALAIEAKSPDQVLRAKLLCLSARAQFMLGNRELAQRNLEAGISMAHNEPYVQAVCLDDRAYFKSIVYDLGGSLRDLHLAQKELLQSGVNKPTLALKLMTDLADIYANLGRSDEAEHMNAAAAELLNQLGRGETSGAIDLQNNWGIARASSGDPLGALQHYDIALEIAHKRGVSPERDTSVALSRALTLRQLARDEEAITIYDRLIVQARRDRDKFILAYAKAGMARSLVALGHISEAEKILKEVASMIGKEIPNHGSYVDNIIGIQGMLAMKQHHYKEAIQNYSKLIDGRTAHNVSGSHLSYGLTQRGEAYLLEKNFSAALSDATAAWDKGHSAQGKFPYSNASGDAALLLAKIHYSKNEKDEAHKWAAIAFQQLQGSVGADHPDTLEAKRLLDSFQSSH